LGGWLVDVAGWPAIFLIACLSPQRLQLLALR
jgi:hypothetical protein